MYIDIYIYINICFHVYVCLTLNSIEFLFLLMMTMILIYINIYKLPEVTLAAIVETSYNGSFAPLRHPQSPHTYPRHHSCTHRRITVPCVN